MNWNARKFSVYLTMDTKLRRNGYISRIPEERVYESCSFIQISLQSTIISVKKGWKKLKGRKKLNRDGENGTEKRKWEIFWEIKFKPKQNKWKNTKMKNGVWREKAKIFLPPRDEEKNKKHKPHFGGSRWVITLRPSFGLS